MNESLETTQPLTNGTGIMYDTTMISIAKVPDMIMDTPITGQLNSK